MSASVERLRVLTAGIMSLIVLVGIARFAYTPILPIMQQQAGLGIYEAGWLATINYVGYLSGAIIASQISSLVLKDKLYRIGLIVAVVSTLGMGLTDNIWLWSILRFFAGLSSAAGLLLASGLIMNWLIRNGHRSELGIHFSGMGLGIIICSLLVELASRSFDWQTQWYLLTVLGVVLLIPAWAWLPRPDTSGVSNSGQTLVDSPPSDLFMRLFMLSYFCAGVGMVVSSTFIVSIIDQQPSLAGLGAWTFMILGIGAAPACIVWDLVARRIGDVNALIAASLLQAVSILLPLAENNLFMAISGAVLFGFTFIGVVSLVLSMAGRYYPTKPAKMMGKMTITYGIAQIISPSVVGWLAKDSGDYSIGLYIASAAMLVSVFVLIPIRKLA
ncbi:YbfB/YjiJ family MFS transporter [Leucothrix arctica]|uniref:MFS transporter n=1 Tax=Leucothrix arctica TaxID=1481894 RepID=A0A317CMJ7_9GAMM|nr:YbfB/YjiJ family MFS transporter [Leucothrix arctica]PWQ97540.1 MFS transporter [Leucothrix arctica]